MLVPLQIMVVDDMTLHGFCTHDTRFCESFPVAEQQQFSYVYRISPGRQDIMNINNL